MFLINFTLNMHISVAFKIVVVSVGFANTSVRNTNC
jgi:hypothetical protein